MNQLSTGLNLADIVDEYVEKLNSLPQRFDAFVKAKGDLEMSCSIMGTYGGNIWPAHSVEPSPDNLQKVLNVSAWNRVYKSWIENIATAKDKGSLIVMLENPPEFTVDNLREEFGSYVADPWGAILRGLAEVFCSLDPYYKSHTKVGVGKKGLPKRVIVTGFNYWTNGGKDKLVDIVNAIRAYRRDSIANTYRDVSDWVDSAKTKNATLDGLTLKLFQNGNGHVHFDKKSLNDVNKALSEYYGEVLPDVDVKTSEKQSSKEVSKDLQYYPTPESVVKRLFYDIYLQEGMKALEPSCGCGRIMDYLKSEKVNVQGIEYDQSRANEARSKGHAVTVANFLEIGPKQSFDLVVMNPPFYGKHYIKHVEHAINFLSTGGKLVSILPASARYDHGIINKQWAEAHGVRIGLGAWRDLPVGSFSESGTNINTVTLTITKY